MKPNISSYLVFKPCSFSSVWLLKTEIPLPFA